MKRSILTGMFSLLALLGMALTANAQLPIVRGVARNAVRIATPNVDVQVGGAGAAVAAPQAEVAVENNVGAVVVTRRAWLARPRAIAGAAIQAAATNVVDATVSATTATAASVQSTAVVAAPAYVQPAAVDCCGQVIYSGGTTATSSYSASSSYSGGAAVASGVVTRAAPVAAASTVVTRSVVARPMVGTAMGTGVNVVTPRVGVHVGR